MGWKNSAWVFKLPVELNREIEEYEHCKWTSIMRNYIEQEEFRKKRLVISIKAWRILTRLRDRTR